MDKRSTFIIVGIILVAAGVFVAVYFTKLHIGDEPLGENTASTTEWMNAPAEKPATVLPVAAKVVVTAKHAYQNGTHTIAGEIPLPTPCHILDASIMAAEDKKHLQITLDSRVKTGELCAQVITPARFKVSGKADKNATIAATLNGQEVTLNLIEAGPNENLDNFELYIKG